MASALTAQRFAVLTPRTWQRLFRSEGEKGRDKQGQWQQKPRLLVQTIDKSIPCLFLCGKTALKRFFSPMQGDDAEVWTGLYHDVGQKNADKLRIEQAETLKNK